MLQEHARDSFENLLFSLCRFYELTGHYPDNVLVIGYNFKHERFADLHRAALRWPDQKFTFVGTPALTAGAQEVRFLCTSMYNSLHLHSDRCHALAAQQLDGAKGKLHTGVRISPIRSLKLAWVSIVLA